MPRKYDMQFREKNFIFGSLPIYENDCQKRRNATNVTFIFGRFQYPRQFHHIFYFHFSRV